MLWDSSQSLVKFSNTHEEEEEEEEQRQVSPSSRSLSHILGLSQKIDSVSLSLSLNLT